jgi:hypothetical protein
MDELFPIVGGILLGFAFAGFAPLQPLWIRITLVVVLGVAATVLSGEAEQSWGFVLVDIGEVGLLAWIAHVGARAFKTWFGKRAIAPPPH